MEIDRRPPKSDGGGSTRPTLIAAAMASVCRAAGPVGVLKRVAPAEAAVTPGIGHALLEGIEAAVRSAPPTSSVFGAPRRSRDCIGAQHEGGQQDGCHGEGAHEVPPQSSPTQPKDMASQNGFNGASSPFQRCLFFFRTDRIATI